MIKIKPTLLRALQVLPVVALGVLVAAPAAVQAFPSAAGGCQTGAAAVSGLHLQNGPGESTLDALGIEISVDGEVLTPVSLGGSFAIASGVDHTVEVTATVEPFRGFLLALSSTTDATDLSTALTPVDTAIEQPAGVCIAPVVGVTHTSAADKTSASATLRLDQGDDLNLDVTVVMLNSGGVSLYAYERYSILVTPAQTTGAPVATTAAPVATTAAPVTTTAAPVATTAAPVATTAAPVATTAAPVVVTPTWSDSPSASPTWAKYPTTPPPSTLPTSEEPAPSPPTGGGGTAPTPTSGGAEAFAAVYASPWVSMAVAAASAAMSALVL